MYRGGRLVKEGGGEEGEGEGDEDRMVHGQGRALVESVGSESRMLDLATLQAGCQQRTLSGGECYEAFKAAGVADGVAHQGLEEVDGGVDSEEGAHVLAHRTGPSGGR